MPAPPAFPGPVGASAGQPADCPVVPPDTKATGMLSWREFWDSAHSIYVNDRHKDVHYRDVAGEIAAFVPGPDARVLDHGCGEAIHADLVAARARDVLL